MALPATSGANSTPPNLPVVGQGGLPGQPPGGPQGVSQPTPNRGNQAAALGMLTHVIRILERILPQAGVETEVGRDVMKALTNLSKHVTPGSGSPGVENSALQGLMMQQKQQAPLIQALRAQGAGGPGGMGAPAPAQAA